MNDDLLSPGYDLSPEYYRRVIAQANAEIERLAAALGACADDLADAWESATIAAGARVEAEAELVTARSVTRRLADGWLVDQYDDGRYHWHLRRGIPGDMHDFREPMPDAARAWLASVASTPTATDIDEDPGEERVTFILSGYDDPEGP